MLPRPMAAALLLGLAAALGLPARAQSMSASADVEAPLLLPNMQLHDPFIVADPATRTYHLFTRNEPAMTGDTRLGTMAYSSRDLKHWTRPKLVFTLPEGTWANAGSWAPEVHRWRGKYYLLTTFHNSEAKLPPVGRRKPYRRGTVLAVADDVLGPYRLVRDGEPVVPKELMTLDGTLHVDAEGKPWLVYAHEWLQTTVGTIEALPLDEQLRAAGKPHLLFRANEAAWADAKPQPEGDSVYVTDGPQFYRTKSGTLLMLWSSYDKRGYVQSLARSKSGNVVGPWEQLDPLVRRDSGHGMIFNAFDGRLMMVLHRPFTYALGKLYEMRDLGDRLEIVREATELDGEAYPTHPCVTTQSPTGNPLPPC